MKRRMSVFLLFLMMILACTCASGENTSDSFVIGEWSWEPSHANEFSGSFDLSEYSGQELTVILKAETEPAIETETVLPVFTTINGSRVRMIYQKESAAFTPDSGQTSFAFTGTLKMPAETRLQKVSFTATVCDNTGKQLKTASAAVSMFDGRQGNTSGAFVIPVDIRTVTLVLTCAACLVWALAIIRNRLADRKEK